MNNYFDKENDRYFQDESGYNVLEEDDSYDIVENHEDGCDDSVPEKDFTEKEITEIEENVLKNVPKDIRSQVIHERFYGIMEEYHSGNEAKRQKAAGDAILMLRGIIRMIIKKHYSTYTKNHFSDLEQQGCIGVMMGLMKYNPDKGKPSTFFYKYIVHEMQDYIDEIVNKTSAHYATNIRKITKAENTLIESGQEPTNVAIAILTNLTLETVEQARKIKTMRDEVHYEACPESYIDGWVGVEEKQTPEQEVIENETHNFINEVVDETLLPEEIAVLEKVFGIHNSETKSYKEISEILNMPIDRVRKYYADALRKLRNSKLRGVFVDYLKSEEPFITDNEDVQLYPREQALRDSELLEAVEINF